MTGTPAPPPSPRRTLDTSPSNVPLPILRHRLAIEAWATRHRIVLAQRDDVLMAEQRERGRLDGLAFAARQLGVAAEGLPWEDS